jgi:hypothetical protein
MQIVRIVRAGLGLALAGGMIVSCASSHQRARSSGFTPKESAVALGHRMLDRVVLPAGARVSNAKAPSVLGGPSVPGIGNLEFAHRFWVIHEDPRLVYKWLQAHVPSGFRRTGTSTGTNRGVPSWGVTDAVAVEPANISDAELQFAIAGNAAGGTTVRVDTVVSWTEPRPVDEFVPRRDRTVIVTVLHPYEPGTREGKRVATSDPKVVGPIVRAFNRLKVAPPEGVHGCPVMGIHTASYRIAFATSPRATPNVVATIGKCSRGPSVTVDGRAAPNLLDTVTSEFADAVARVLGFTEPHFG